jgi:hypothetical protein
MALTAGPGSLSGRDIRALVFMAEMYGVQLDHLAAILGTGTGRAGTERARAAAVRWRALGYADSARLGPGPPWIWVTRNGLSACGLKFTAAPPALSRLAHIRAVTSVRLALEATGGYRQARAFWRAERRLRSRHGVGVREHLPDGEVHWPDDAGVACAGECWAVEAELTRKTVTRTVAIMREILSRTGEYGCPAAEAVVPSRPPRYPRALYLCSAAALTTVTRARDELGAALASRIEIRNLPRDAGLASPTGTARTARTARLGREAGVS